MATIDLSNFSSLLVQSTEGRGDVELAGQEVATLSTQTYSYNYAGDQDVMLQIIETGYEEFLNQYVLGGADQNVTIRLVTETNI